MVKREKQRKIGEYEGKRRLKGAKSVCLCCHSSRCQQQQRIYSRAACQLVMHYHAKQSKNRARKFSEVNLKSAVYLSWRCMRVRGWRGKQQQRVREGEEGTVCHFQEETRATVDRDSGQGQWTGNITCVKGAESGSERVKRC